MSLIKKGRRSCRALARALARVWKFLLRQLTRQGELERALRRALADERGGHSPDLVKAIASSLARSSQLADIKAAVFGKRPFSASVASAKIIKEKGIGDEKVGATLTWSLQVLAEVNAVHERVGELQRQSYDPSEPSHVALLEALWESLKPGMRRTDWGELGFQNGERPQSDFRGMGMLGLHQLVYFAQRRNREAILILAESENPNRYFPFAAAGINITAFVTNMLEERRLDIVIYESLLKHIPPGRLPDESFDDETLVAAGVAALNEVYGEEYVRFSRFWCESMPENTMAFPGVFKTIKQRSNARFPPLVQEE
eukprot:jgi/Undpi1/129/HiC_scaffold_1.g00129.m1